jgi:hypothetical protein
MLLAPFTLRKVPKILQWFRHLDEKKKLLGGVHWKLAVLSEVHYFEIVTTIHFSNWNSTSSGFH